MFQDEVCTYVSVALSVAVPPPHAVVIVEPKPGRNAVIASLNHIIIVFDDESRQSREFFSPIPRMTMPSQLRGRSTTADDEPRIGDESTSYLEQKRHLIHFKSSLKSSNIKPRYLSLHFLSETSHHKYMDLLICNVSQVYTQKSEHHV